jgi:tetratricopeptide (TPR) repeat protein
VFAAGVLAMSLLGWQTLRYAEAWKQDLTIWKWGHEHDKNSHFCLHHYALELVNESIRKIEEGDKAGREGHGEEAKRLRDEGHADREHARQLFKRALDIRPAGPTFLALADTYFLDSMYNQAESLMVMTINAYRESNFYPTEYMYAVDSLARVYLERDDNLDAAVKVYRDALPHVPGIKARIYDRMAMITIRWAQIHDPAPDRWDQALAILEEGRAAVGADPSLESHMLDFRLGQVYARKGRLDEAVARFEAFLRGVQGLDDANVAEAAEVARTSIEQIRKLRSSGPSSGTR